MSNRETSPGLSFGQLVTLTFGFLLASALIFIFGFWVGYDAAQRRIAREQQFVRLPVAQPPTRLAAAATPPEPVERLKPTSGPPAATGEVAAKVQVPPSESPTGFLSATDTPRPPTATPSLRAPTKTVPSIPTRTRTRSVVESPGSTKGGIWTVEVGATTDVVQAVVLKQRLVAKGYPAYTATAKVGDVIWYRVRVGRFDDRLQAKVLEIRLKDEEGLTGASVVQQ